MSEIEALTEEERHLVEEAIADVEASESALYEGTDVGRPELAEALRKMQAAYTALVVERVRIADLERDNEGWARNVQEMHERLRTVEAKETTRNAARLAELASGTVNRVEYDRMVEQRDTIRKERTEARDRARTLRGILGDVLADLVKLREDPAQLWLLEEAIATADLEGYKYNCDSPDYVEPPST